MKGDPIPPHNHVARYCKASTFFVDQNGQPTRVLESAFRPRPSDGDGISVIWSEFFQGTRPHNLACVRSVTKLTVKPTDSFALLHVGKMVNSLVGVVALVVEEDPVDDLPPHKNAAHALIKPVAALNDQGVRDIIASTIVLPGDLEKY